MTPEQALHLLAAAPVRIAKATAGLTPEQLVTPPDPGEWSVNEVLAHLRSCSDVWGDAAQAIADGATTLRAVNPRTWIKQTDYPKTPFAVSFAAYRRQRDELVAFLTSLPDDVWARTATITGAGKPLKRSVLDYADWIARHERAHLKQIEGP